MNRLVASLAKLAAAFPAANPTEATLAVYVEQLNHLHQPTVIQAIDDLISHARKFPTVAEIRDVYKSLRSRDVPEAEALPVGRSPMPDEVREQIRKLNETFSERAEEIA